MYRTIYIVYYLLYTITDSTIQYSHYIMYRILPTIYDKYKSYILFTLHNVLCIVL